jgi:hypothetical protein
VEADAQSVACHVLQVKNEEESVAFRLQGSHASEKAWRSTEKGWNATLEPSLATDNR